MSKPKPKVKVSITCPHCECKNVREANPYHGILHKQYFKQKDILDFEETKSKVDSGEYPYSILWDILSWMKPFLCDECGKGIKLYHVERSQWNETTGRGFLVVKAGKFIDSDFIDRLFKYLEPKNRGVGKDYNPNNNLHLKCQKEIFINRVWQKVKDHFTDRLFIIKDSQENKHLLYIGGVSYHLGYGEELDVFGIAPTGQVKCLRLSKYDMQNLEYVRVHGSLGRELMKLSAEM